jgi:capsular exopolysaccharide synthesis family protein
MVRRRRAIIVGCALIGTMLGASVGVLRAPRYTAETLLVIEVAKPSGGSDVLVGDPMGRPVKLDPAVVETQIEMLRNPEYVAKLVDRLDEAGPVPPDPPGDSLPTALRDWLLANPVVAKAIAAWSRAAITSVPAASRAERIIALRDGLDVTQQGGSYVISIKYTLQSRQQAAQVTNTLAELYIEDQRQRQEAQIHSSNSALEATLREFEEAARRAEQAVNDYRTRQPSIASSRPQNADRRIADLSRMLVETRAERTGLESRLKQVSLQKSRGLDLGAMDSILESPRLTSLWEQQQGLSKQSAELHSSYGAKHPLILKLEAEQAAVAAKINVELARIMESMGRQVEELRDREQLIEADIDRVQTEAGDAARASADLERLTAEADASRKRYDDLLQRYKVLTEQQKVAGPTARVIARASPPTEPSSPGLAIFAGGGLAFSLLGGLLLAGLRDFVDTTVRSGKDLERRYGVRFLGLVPLLEGRQLRRCRQPHRYLVQRPLSLYAEGIRSIITGLGLTEPSPAGRVIQITSACPGEGKTTTAISLATSLADDGVSSVLLDLDLRRPSVRREFPNGQSRDLLSYLIGASELDELLRSSRQPSRADVIGLEKPPHNPPQLFLSDRILALIDELRARYHVVVIDSAPILAVADGRLVARLADTAVLVARYGVTTVELVGDAIEALVASGIAIGGVAITQVDMRRHAAFGRGGIDSYYTKYRDYYVE